MTQNGCYDNTIDAICYWIRSIPEPGRTWHTISLDLLREWIGLPYPPERVFSTLTGLLLVARVRRLMPANRCYYIKRKRRRGG